MKRFSFRLSPVLRLRRAAEQEALRNLGDARRGRDAAAESARTRLEEEQAAKVEQSAAQRPGGLAVPTLLAHQRHVAAAGRRVFEARAALAAQDAALEEARLAWIAASRDRKAMDRLRERRESAWVAEGLREEQKTIDEAASRAGGARG